MSVGIQCFVVIQDLFKIKVLRVTQVLRATRTRKDETMKYLSTREMAEKWGVVQSGQNSRSSIQRGRLAHPRGRNPCVTDRFGVYIGGGVAGTGQKAAKSEEKAEFSWIVRFCGN